MANKLVETKVVISTPAANELVASIRDGLRTINKGYLAIAPDVAKLYDGEAYKALGYKNFDELCRMEFEMAHGTTVGIRKVFAKFGSKNTKTGAYSIPEKYTEWGYTKLLLFCDKRFEEVGINPLEEFNPSMTIGQMRATLDSLLEDKAKAQEANAIDTTATDVSRETSADLSDTSEYSSEEETQEVQEATDKDLLNDIMELAKELKNRMNYIGGEKSCLLDEIIATAKELKRVAK